MNKHNTIGKGVNERAVNGGLDKFYTKQFIADYYSNIVLARYGSSVSYIEPTAGNGAFLNVLPDIVGYDLKPECAGVAEMDVFNNTFGSGDVIVGNPPFGMSAGLAISIFNHIASFKCKAICFIVPRTFKKGGVQDKLDLHYKLVFEQDVIDNAFSVEGNDKDVPCVFQIWEHKKRKRKVATSSTCKWFDYTNKDSADIAVRRVGGRAGQLLSGLDYSTSTTYFLKVHNKLVSKAVQLIDLTSVNHTAGVRSISKQELCDEINRVMEVLA